MKKQILISAAVLMGLVGADLIALSLRQTVTLVVDGQPRTIRSYAFSTNGVLRDAGISLGPGDTIRPATGTRFWNAPQLEVLRARPVTLIAAGEPQTLTTSVAQVGALLAGAGYKIYPGDLLLVDGAQADADTPLSPGQPHVVQFRPAVKITLTEDETTTSIYSSASTLGEGLWQAGYRITPADVLEPASNTPLDGPISASLVRARPVAIEAYGQQLEISTAAETVGEALAAAGLPLQGMDYSLPAEGESIPVNRKIKIVRVQEQYAISLETVPFKTTYELDPETELDQESVIQPGVTGLIATRERITYEDGQEMSRQTDGTWTARNPADAITGQGMKVVVRKIEGTDYEYWRKITVYATSYSPCRVGGGRCDNSTAIGLAVTRGVIAVTVRWFRDMKLQKVYVPGYGTGVIGDTGGGIPGRYWIDLGFTDDDYESWHQWTTLYFLTPVPQYIPYILYP